MLIEITDTDSFIDFTETTIEQGDYRYLYLRRALNAVYNREIDVDPKSFVDVEEDSWILFVIAGGTIFIYGAGYSGEQISRFIQTIDLKVYEGLEIMGTFELVYLLLERSGVQNFKVIKDRCLYQLRTYAGAPQQEQIGLATMNDADFLISLFQEYYAEEYNGERNKTAQSLQPMVVYHIQDNSLYVFREHGQIVAFCSVNNPDIGILYTVQDFRNRGIGRRLLEYCSSILYIENHVVYVITDMHNLSSNIICGKIGYELFYRHTNMLLLEN